MAKTNHESGIEAEAAVCKYLMRNDFSILNTRYKNKVGEIDIIAVNDNTILFIEVKRRKAEVIDDPVTYTQKKRIINAALQYISENPEIAEYDMRFDCILVDNDLSVNHIEDSWRIEEI